MVAPPSRKLSYSDPFQPPSKAPQGRFSPKAIGITIAIVLLLFGLFLGFAFPTWYGIGKKSGSTAKEGLECTIVEKTACLNSILLNDNCCTDTASCNNIATQIVQSFQSEFHPINANLLKSCRPSSTILADWRTCSTRTFPESWANKCSAKEQDCLKNICNTAVVAPTKFFACRTNVRALDAECLANDCSMHTEEPECTKPKNAIGTSCCSWDIE